MGKFTRRILKSPVRDFYIKYSKRQDGATIVIVAAMMVVLFGCTAIVVDAGLLYVKRQKLANTVDAAALAAVQETINGEDPARRVALDYVQKNGLAPEKVVVNVNAPGKTVDISARDNVKYTFARILGFMESDVTAYAKAAAYPVTAATGVRPLGIEDFSFQYGVRYVLKEGVDDSYNGNFGPLSLGATGANSYRNNIINGYVGKLKVGDWVQTETGNMPSPTLEGVDYLVQQCNHSPKCTISSYAASCSRLITIPVLSTLHVNGRGEVQVVGFAKFLLEGIRNTGGHLEVTGWFVKNTDPGESSLGGLDRGLYSIRLIK